MHAATVGPGGARIRWVELPGRGPARVFVHGLGASSPPYFAATAAHPALAGHRTLLVDLLGFGISDRPAGFGYSLTDHADALAAALDAAGVAGGDLVGHSMGGSVAIALAARRPDLVGRLVVAEANLVPSPRPRILGRSEDDFVARGFAAALEAVGPDWAATMRLADPRALYRTELALGHDAMPRLDDVLAGLALPRTYLQGARSGPLAGAEALAAAGVDVRIVPDAGHVMMFDAPAAFAETVAAALAG